MSSLPLASVIMVTYNSERFVRSAIESILCQSYAHFELIICDDASRDGTWGIIEEFRDSRIRAFRNEKNIGEYPNRNEGIGVATGEYLIFIDGDDMMYPHGLEFMVKMLDAFPECGMALMRWWQNNIFFPVTISPRQFYEGVYFGYGFNDTAFTNILFRTSVLKAAGGLNERYKAGDSYIRLKIAAGYPCLLINDDLTWWRETPGQASSKLANTPEGVIDDHTMLSEFLAYPDCPLSAEDREAAKRNVDHILSRYVLRLLLRLRWGMARQVLRACGFPFAGLFRAFGRVDSRDPFAAFTTTAPFMLDWKRNPYARVENLKR